MKQPALGKALFLLIAQLVVAGVFVAAAIPKISDPVAFESSVLAYRVIGSPVAYWVALFLPWLELLAGLGLLIRPIQRASGTFLSILLLTFIILHASAWARGLNVDCGCFGNSEETTNYLSAMIRNTLLLLASLWATVHSFRNFKAGSPSQDT